MDEEFDREQIRQHSAGATILHTSPFSNLPTPKNSVELSQAMLDKWVVPFCLKMDEPDAQFYIDLKNIKPQITKEIVITLLGDANWRSRKVAALFTAVKNYTDLIEPLGNNLLKSEVCFAGKTYAKTFVIFNTKESVDYLDKYLEHYLSQKQLHFDQLEVGAALRYLDKKYKTDRFNKHKELWLEWMLGRSVIEYAAWYNNVIEEFKGFI